MLGLVDLVVAVLEQLLNDVLNVLTHIAGLGEGGGIGDDKRHIEQARQGLGQQGLARARGPDEQDVALGELDFALFALLAKALVMVVNRNRQPAFGTVLPDHVGIKNIGNFLRGGQGLLGGLRGWQVGLLVTNDVVAEFDAFIADKNRRTSDQLFHFMLAFAAEGTVEKLLSRPLFICH